MAQERARREGQDQDQGQGQTGPMRVPRHRRSRPPAARQYWVRRDFVAKQRLQSSHYYALLLTNMGADDAQGHKIFFNYKWIKMETFTYLVQLVQPRIRRQDTMMRDAPTPGLKLACTLRYLATGDSFHSLGYAFHVAHNTVSKFIPEVCSALVDTLNAEAFPPMLHTDDWLTIALRFERQWNMPQCLGALDGKHIRILPPPASGTHYYNYKGFFSVPMLALADADCKFICLDLGGGRAHAGRYDFPIDRALLCL